MYKQIIIARKDLNMSPGKLAAQVSHGSMAFLTWMIRDNIGAVAKERGAFAWDALNNPQEYRHPDLNEIAKHVREKGGDYFYYKPKDPKNPFGELVQCENPTIEAYSSYLYFDKDLYEQWINGQFTKCVLQAKNKNQLLKAKSMAEDLRMTEGKDFWLIKDNCHTELEPEEDGRTLTCIGFRPMDSETIDKIGKKYHLYM